MRKFYFTLLIVVLFSVSCFAQFSNYVRVTPPKPYKTALTLSNPLGSMSKSASGVEHRLGNFSYMAYYTLYRGAYPGAQADIDLRFYKRKYFQHIRYKWIYQDFYYTRAILLGVSAFDGDRLKIVGYPDGIYWYDKFYTGGAIGWGRRYQKGMFFLTARAGLRAVMLEPIEPEAKHLYRLFYLSGPGSVLELNFQFGIQI